MSRQIRRWISQPSTKRLIGLVMTVLVSGIALIVLIKDSHRLLAYSFRLDPSLVLLSFAVECGGLVALAVPVWHQMLTRFGSHLSYRDDLRIYCYSMLGIAVPGGFWPLITRAALYERWGVISIRVIVASVVECALIGLAGLVVYGATAVLGSAGDAWQRPGIGLGVAALALLLLHPPLFNRGIGWLLRRADPDRELSISLRYRHLARWLLVESLMIVVGGTAVYVLLRSLTDARSSLFVSVVGAWAAAAVVGNLFFWVPGTPIIRDSAMTLILAQSLPASVVILFVLLVRVWTLASILVVAGLAWLLLERDIQPIRPRDGWVHYSLRSLIGFHGSVVETVKHAQEYTPAAVPRRSEQARRGEKDLRISPYSATKRDGRNSNNPKG